MYNVILKKVYFASDSLQFSDNNLDEAYCLSLFGQPVTEVECTKDTLMYANNTAAILKKLVLPSGTNI